MSAQQKITLNWMQLTLLQFKTFSFYKNKLLGRQGEILASQYLHAHNFLVISKNWTSKLGEIDLIAVKARVLIFVEVKTRKSVKYSAFKPYDSVGKKKRKKLIELAELYLERNSSSLRKYRLKEFRVDIISIQKNSSREWLIEHILGQSCTST